MNATSWWLGQHKGHIPHLALKLTWTQDCWVLQFFMKSQLDFNKKIIPSFPSHRITLFCPFPLVFVIVAKADLLLYMELSICLP